MNNDLFSSKRAGEYICARGLLLLWLKGEDINDTFEDPSPEIEEMILLASTDIKDPKLRQKWLETIEGDKSDKRRVELRNKCRDLINKQSYIEEKII